MTAAYMRLILQANKDVPHLQRCSSTRRHENSTAWHLPRLCCRTGTEAGRNMTTLFLSMRGSRMRWPDVGLLGSCFLLLLLRQPHWWVTWPGKAAAAGGGPKGDAACAEPDTGVLVSWRLLLLAWQWRLIMCRSATRCSACSI